MNSPEIISAALAEHRHDLRHEAHRSALAALARCCSPSTWTAVARRISSTVGGSRRSPAGCAC